MKHLILAAACAAAASTSVAVAGSPKVCLEIAAVAQQAAELRDQGVPQPTLRKYIVGGDPVRRKVTLALISVVYSFPNRTPKQLATSLFDDCMQEPMS